MNCSGPGICKRRISTGFSTLAWKSWMADLFTIGLEKRYLEKAMWRLAIVIAAACARLGAQSDAEKLAPYYPTPETIVDKMLQLGGLKAGEKMYDLGSGDGRIVILAAQKFHAEAVGVELDKDLSKRSAARILKLGLDKNAR